MTHEQTQRAKALIFRAAIRELDRACGRTTFVAGDDTPLGPDESIFLLADLVDSESDRGGWLHQLFFGVGDGRKREDTLLGWLDRALSLGIVPDVMGELVKFRERYNIESATRIRMAVLQSQDKKRIAELEATVEVLSVANKHLRECIERAKEKLDYRAG